MFLDVSRFSNSYLRPKAVILFCGSRRNLNGCADRAGLMTRIEIAALWNLVARVFS